MKTIKGPAIFLAQFAGDHTPYDNLSSLAGWAASLGYRAVQIPTWDKRLFDLELAAKSKQYCADIAGLLSSHQLVITELSTHLQGQLVAVNPAYDSLFDGFAAPEVRGKPHARQRWAVDQLILAATASRNLGLDTSVTFSGAFAWPYLYPWPPRPHGLIEQAFDELAKRWRPILDVYDEQGVDLAYEIHPGEDLHDGASFERFLCAIENHSRANILYDPSHFVLQQMDYLQFIDLYHSRIKAFHVKDAEFRPDGRSGVYGGYQEWVDRPGRFRSLGDGQIDFKQIFSKLAHYDYAGWATLEWECCVKDSEAGAREGAQFIARHILPVTERAFDDFSKVADESHNRALLGIASPHDSV